MMHPHLGIRPSEQGLRPREGPRRGLRGHRSRSRHERQTSRNIRRDSFDCRGAAAQVGDGKKSTGRPSPTSWPAPPGPTCCRLPLADPEPSPTGPAKIWRRCPRRAEPGEGTAAAIQGWRRARRRRGRGRAGRGSGQGGCRQRPALSGATSNFRHQLGRTRVTVKVSPGRERPVRPPVLASGRGQQPGESTAGREMALRVSDGLHVHAVHLVLAGVEGPVGGDPVDRQQRPRIGYAFIDAARTATASVGVRAARSSTVR